MNSRKYFFLVAILILSGCAVLKASPALDTGFLPDAKKLSERRERWPFNGVYVSDEKKYSKLKKEYNQIYIKRINTKFLEDKLSKKEESEKAKIYRKEEIQEIANYMRNTFKMRLSHYPEHPFELTEEPGSKTFILELAFAELDPTNPALNATGTVLGFLVPGGGLLSRVHSGSVAIEGIIRDGASGRILLEFKDREGDKTSAFSIKDYQRYAHARDSIEDWADQFAELMATDLDHKVEDSLPFEINPL